MKKLFLACAFIGFTLGAMAQSATTEKQDKPTQKTEKVELKDHKCSADCKAAGKCVMAHGEKGHGCSDACHTAKAGKADHNCNKKCSKGCCHIAATHAYAHGEKGHECSASCKK